MLLIPLLLVAASRLGLGGVWRGNPGEVLGYLLYQAGTLAPNYFQFGAVRRGLGGSIAYLLSRDALLGTICFYALCALGVALVTTRLFRRLEAPSETRHAFALMLLVFMLRWGDDGGRTDLAIAALLGGTAMACARGRYAIAAALVSVGLFVHETSFIFGLPLLLALALQAGWTRITARQRAGALLVLGAAVLLYATLDTLPHASRREIVQVIRTRLPVHVYVDWAMYFALSGMRGVQTSICQNITDPNYWLHIVGGLVLIGVICAALVPNRRATLARALLAALPGFVFLTIVANDIARWALFACFNIWLVAITAPERVDATRSARRLKLAVAALAVPLVLYRPSMIEARVFSPSPLLEAVAVYLGGPATPSFADALARCDPQWRDVLNAD